MRAIGATTGATIPVTINGSSVPSAAAPWAIALIGVILGTTTIVLATFARSKSEIWHEAVA